MHARTAWSPLFFSPFATIRPHKQLYLNSAGHSSLRPYYFFFWSDLDSFHLYLLDSAGFHSSSLPGLDTMSFVADFHDVPSRGSSSCCP